MGHHSVETCIMEIKSEFKVHMLHYKGMAVEEKSTGTDLFLVMWGGALKKKET